MSRCSVDDCALGSDIEMFFIIAPASFLFLYLIAFLNKYVKQFIFSGIVVAVDWFRNQYVM